MRLQFTAEYLSRDDLKPVKTYLPEKLKNRLKTRCQWADLGYYPKDNEIGYELHPAHLNKKLCTYFLDEQVEKVIK